MFLVFGLALAASCPTGAPVSPERSGAHLKEVPGAVRASGRASLRVQVRTRDDESFPVPDNELELRGPDGVVRTVVSDDEGVAELEQLPEGLYTLLSVSAGITVEGLKLSDDRTSQLTLQVPGTPGVEGPGPAPRPAPEVWMRYRRTACFGPCEVFEVQVEHGGRVTFVGQDHVRVEGEAQRLLSADRLARLQERVACARTLPSYGAYQATDFAWTRLEVWEADGSAWTWVWYGGDFRAPSQELTRFRKQLERAMGIERFK